MLRRLLVVGTLVVLCSAWQSSAVDSRGIVRKGAALAAFAPVGRVAGSPRMRLGAASCSVRMVTMGSNDAPAGSAQSYMKKIPPHLQGLAIRKQKPEMKDWSKKTSMEDLSDLARIQAELDDAEDEMEDPVDYAMQMIDELDKDQKAVKMRTYDLDIADADVLKQLKNNMHADDFRKVFGRGVGDLL